MIAEQNYGAHSALVEMQLIINGSSISITHMGRDFVLVKSPADFPPGEASILLKVDDSESRWKVSCPKEFPSVPTAWRSPSTSSSGTDARCFSQKTRNTATLDHPVVGSATHLCCAANSTVKD
jgi:hypothetical protein